MKFDTIQTSFVGGEFGPSLFGRTDIAQYANACEIVENFIIRPYGSAISAPGSVYVATVSDSTLKTRLIKFVFNREDAYVIEMGNRYMRFFTNRGQVISNDSVGTENLSAFSANLRAHYKFNDNTNSTVVIDSSSNSLNGTSSTNTSTLHAAGKIGTGCFDFDGQYSVQVHSASLSFSETAGSNPFSLSFWAYIPDDGNTQDLISKYDTPTKREYLLQLGTTRILSFYLYDDVNNVAVSASAADAISAGWHMLTITYDGRGGATSADGINIYVDNAVVSVNRVNDPAYDNMVANTASFNIGALRDGGNFIRWCTERIDNVAVFNTVLTAANVVTLYAETAGSAYQLPTVFLENEIFDVHYTQLNDVIWLTNSNHPPQELIRTSANEWVISDFNFLGGPFLDDNTDTSITITPSGTSGTINITVTPTTANLFTRSSSTLGHHGAYWMIGGLSATNSTTGLQENGYVEITNVINSYTATATVIKSLKAASATSVWAEGAWSAVRGYPSRVVFHDARLWFGRTNHEPQKIWGSKIYEYDHFELDTEADDDALNLPLASNEANELQWLASTKNLLSGTYGGGFVVSSGADNLAITPDNVRADEEIGIGSAPIQPKRIGQFIYYLQRFKKILRELFYVWDINTYKTVDRTILSPHVLGDGIIDMDVQINQNPILYCVRTEGTLALMSREADQEVTAWSRRTTAGTYTTVAVIPSQTADYDEAWVIVERWVNGVQKKYVEYFENVEIPTRQDLCIYLDSALSYNAYESTSTSSATISLSASSGSVTLTSSTAYFNGGMIGKKIRVINSAGTTLGQGQITATASTLSITLSITTTFSALAYSAGFWGVSVSTVSGLTHLEAKTVGILADGLTESLTRTVASGAVTLGSSYFVIHVGLSYDQILYTLPREAAAQRGTAQGKIQRFSEIALKVNRSTQNFKYGTDASHLDDINMAFTPTVTSLYTGILPPQAGGIAMRGGYKRGAQVYFKNSNPLPMEILSIMGALDTNEK